MNISSPSSLDSASRLFTTKTLKAIVAPGCDNVTAGLIRTLRTDLELDPQLPNQRVVESAYRLLQSHRRTEYLYKNLITNKIFIGRHRAANSTIINEFRIGSAITDSIIVNGSSVAYEIKTELDNLDRLQRQLSEYYKAVPFVNVVVHHSQAERYMDVLEDSPVGLLSVSRRWQLSPVKAPQKSSGALCTVTMFNSMRVSEIEYLLSQAGIEVPKVPNGRRYETYLDLALRLPVGEFEAAFRASLRRRSTPQNRSLMMNPRVSTLRSLIAQLDPSDRQGNTLLQWLDSKG